MPIRMLLKDDHWFGPEDIAGLTEALEGALSKLGVVNRDDPATLTVAKLIIHLAKEGERPGWGLFCPWQRRTNLWPQ